ncbi:MAG: MarR family transcriptional regulator [Coriobacteriia bacterium]|nr:MarR family transcriptional regulator [Coriobacteriia bacterium]
MSEDLRKEEFIYDALPLISSRLQTLADSHCYKLSSKQFRLLKQINEINSPLSLHEIAQWMGSSRQNITKMLKNLEALGYVRVEPSVYDKRSTSVTISSKGRRYLNAQKESYEEFLRLLFTDFSQSELHTIVKFISQFSNRIDELFETSEIEHE